MESAGVIDLSATGAEPHEYLALCDEIERLARIADQAMTLLGRSTKGDLAQGVRMDIIRFMADHNAWPPPEIPIDE